jgi:hypothetical protein
MSQVKQALSHFLSFCFFRRSCERGFDFEANFDER